MPPKRRPRRDEDELQSIRGGAAVTQDLPSMPSRFDTSYGSAPSTMPRNVRRGQVRNIQTAVQDALNDDDSDDDDARGSKSKPKSTPKPKPSRPVQKEPEPEPEPEPDFGPGNGSDSDLPVSPRDLTPEPPRAHNSPRRSPPGIAPTVEPASFQGDLPRGARGQRFLPSAAPPRGSDVAPGQTPRRASSEGPVLPPTTNTSSGNPGPSRLNPPTRGSLFQRAVSEDRDRYALRRSGSEEPVRTPDSTRTFGQESSLFGDAVIGSTPNKSPSPGNRPITTIEEEDSPIEAEDREAAIVKSPSKRPVLRHPKHNPPMAPRSFNQTEPRDPDMQQRVEEEREKDEAEQQALRSERKARLQAWPRIYVPIYSWTKTARPDTPPVPTDGTPQRRPGRQTPMDQLGWGPWLMFTIADTFVDVLGFIFSPEAWLIRTAVAVLLLSFLGWTIFSGLSAIPAFSLGGLQWYGFSDIAHNLGQFMPLWVTRPSTMFSDEDTREYLRQQRDHEYEITKLMTSTKLHEGSLSKLEQIMPKIVRMELDKQGRPVVSQDFYHALRDLMKSDKEVLTLDRGHGGYHYISDEHWRAIRDKLKKDPVYQKAANPPAPGVSPSQVEDIFQNNFSKSWEKWLRNNNQQVAKILEPAFGTSIPDKIEKDLGQKLEKYVKDLYKEKGTKDVVVTREEFIRHLKGEFATHRNEVKAEVQELQKKLEDFISKSVDLAMSKAPPSGVSRAEMIHFVDDLVRQAIANAGLEALAKGKIGANWNHELSRQVNYLTVGGGTIIDPMHTSPNFKPKFKGPIGSAAWMDSTRRSPFILPPSKTQLRWEDDGECWCGEKAIDKQGRPLGVFISYLISHEIVPQHLVVEHILPSATWNAEARPKELEVWAYITEINLRSRVEDFSASHFPSNPREKWLEDGWIKISQFTYESNDASGGIHVHQLSPELVTLGAATDHIIIRAVSNHGADHTCFYRNRLFGERLV
ncbi:hypothetical protein CkaCkLH20_10136 [Colletotrichum karsti]|uniref:SUN domain-containing protein n=1 Tax=Colletotrichum karsti TaxID=1095194 RepID=A0A9P6LDT3_9PEZI|nr:uncharacterized protein CkaCkLH20_10136 [Colletotrichum karsti]KAF9872309.1 hypothetical protein CkaCkLH20_10136 [Colletotrichum karsti]